MRYVISLVCALCVSSAQAASISNVEPPDVENWVEITISGEFHLGHDKLLIYTNSDFDKVMMNDGESDTPDDVLFEQEDGSYHFWNQRSALHWIQLFNQSFPLDKAQEFHFGEFLSEDPNVYMEADSIEMIGGVHIPDEVNPTHQEWTYIIDGGEPSTIQIELVPEPSAFAMTLMSVGVLFVFGLLQYPRRK